MDDSSSSSPSCCPPGSLGPAPPSSHIPKGNIIFVPRVAPESKNQQMEVYIVEPAEAKNKAIIVGHDVFGVESGRTKLICDRLAETLGVIVVLPSFWKEKGGAGGDSAQAYAAAFANSIESLPPRKGEEQMEKHQDEEGEEKKEEEEGFLTKTGRILKGVVNAPSFFMGIAGLKWATVEAELTQSIIPMVKEKGVQDIAVLGFCWGGWFITHACSLPEICCGAAFHPSLEVCSLVGEDPKKVCAEVHCPQMMLTAQNDKDDVKERGMAHSTYLTKPFGKHCVFKTFERMIHGWVNRGCLSDPVVKRDVEEAIVMVIGFF
eukprot:CAMPEP_0201489616 /NCGR_PEP_ID=MMETSP0151_2-20130828/22999_1 /ASSEMBLY_ACC=CAM_ASM_000257 /TAXON_ID=200890 /ORGANISM="Paramoeba atlantica, Strain 621/1 / CCAP 1560/9" /LENGTH=318 /DNA_ID=CAMNT_0047875263 /DNA_START=90 /DNA_END=1043 /DNA_ORIENTATION=+